MKKEIVGSAVVRHLVVSANERSWKKDAPLLFLGEWCRLYGRKHVWDKLDSILATPYGVTKAEKDINAAEARWIEEEFFRKLAPLLSEIHGVQYKNRFWRILIGHWLRRQIEVTLNRERALKQCFQNYRLDSVLITLERDFSLSTRDTENALQALGADNWNELFYLRLIKGLIARREIAPIAVECNVYDPKALVPLEKTKTEGRILFRSQLMKCLLLVSNLTSLFKRNTDAFIVNSYLSKWMEIKLQLMQFQLPQFRKKVDVNVSSAGDQSKRSTLKDKFSRKIREDKILSKYELYAELLIESIPACYVEHFKSYLAVANSQKWPSKPKYIFTSNNFDTDEVFKFWAADQTEKGTPYIVGAHGNYGVTKFDINPGIEEVTSDVFVTWGWRDGLAQHVPAFVFTIAGRKKIAASKKGGVLLVQVCEPHRMWTWDATYEHAQYTQNQQTFVSLLPQAIRSSLTVRLHSGFQKSRWGEIDRWRDFDADLTIDLGDRRMRDVIPRYRLIVHSYDSTGIVETLAQNIPTMAFWLFDYDMIRDSATPYYESLFKAGILHFEAESITKKIASIWDNVDAWWNSSEVQSARKLFCSNYGRVSHQPLQDLTKILNNAHSCGKFPPNYSVQDQ